MAGISFGGLASGLDTASIISSLMGLERQPRTRLVAEQSAQQTSKTAIQTAITTLKDLQSAARALSDPALFGNRQTVTVADPSRVSATMTGGAAAGGYAVQVDQLARAAQAGYAFTEPVADGSIVLSGDGWSDEITFAAGTTAQDIVSRINGDTSLHVVAAVSVVGGQERLTFSSRTTGADSGFTAASAGVLSDETLRSGLDAVVQIDGVEHRSATNTIADAIPGVALTITGVTATPTTVNVGVPGVDTDAAKGAAEAFVKAYNSAVDLLRTQTANDPSGTKGVLAADRTMIAVLDGIRDALISIDGGGASLPLEALGITNGAASGTAAYSQDAIRGRISLDADKLVAALTTDPAAVRDALGGPGSVLTGLVDRIQSYTGATGVLTDRISAVDQTIADLGRRMTDLDARLTAKEASLTAQFARLEVAMSKWQTQSSWLSGQINSLSSSSN
ncbi:MAG: flagellar filament capping protein FliD [Solirubrobacteraceae bacterium]|nr:flagellar filament capping protein FliD [Solirubrobacteraceae bacterium]